MGAHPDGLKGEEIPLESRIVACCDTWNVMRTNRSYRRALSREVALTELRPVAGTLLDPAVVEALCAVVEEEAPPGGWLDRTARSPLAATRAARDRGVRRFAAFAGRPRAGQIRGDRDALQRSALTSFCETCWSQLAAMPDGERPRRCVVGLESRALQSRGRRRNPDPFLAALMEPVARRLRKRTAEAIRDTA